MNHAQDPSNQATARLRRRPHCHQDQLMMTVIHNARTLPQGVGNIIVCVCVCVCVLCVGAHLRAQAWAQAH
jgi:hypothetical protein